MSSASVQEDQSLEVLVAQVADEFLDRQKRGERPDVEEYAARHPEVAALLRKVLAALEVVGLSLCEAAALAGDLSEPPLAGTLGDFRLLREVGRGGMGVVYEAEQISLRRRVALKVLPFAATMDPKRLQRFQNEAQAAAQLHHSNIVPVYAVGCERGVHYYAMQYIEGQTLAGVIEELSPKQRPSGVRQPSEQNLEPAITPAPQAADSTRSEIASLHAETKPIAGLSTERARDREFFRNVSQLGIQAAEALDYAHEVGVVHRDVKPANLLLDVRGHMWVTDFGLAQVRSEQNLTLTGDLVGTLRYMSPEQALAKRVPIDHRTDIYSLGATLYELVTLRPVHAGQDRQELLRQIAFDEPTPPRKWDRSVPPELETIVLKALEKLPAERYATAQALAEDLRRFLMHEPIQARRSSLVQRARKVVRRHPGVTVTAAVALLVGLLLGIAGLAVNNRMVRNEKLHTQEALDRAEKQKAIAEAVSDFLRNKLLAQADPYAQAEALRKGTGKSTAAKPNPTVRELLDRAASELTPDRIDAQFPGQPLVQAAILKTVGEAYGGIREHELAVAHLERARELLVRELGADDLDSLATLESLGRAYFALGRHEELLSLREQILRVRKARLGPDHRDTLTSMMHVANSYAMAGRLSDALRLHSDTLARRRILLGSDDLATLQSINNVAICYARLGQDTESLTLHDEALALRRAKLGNDHPHTLESLNNVGVAYSNLGRHAEALGCHEEALARRTDKLGSEHRDTLKSMNAVSWILANAPDQKLRDPARALGLAKEAVKLAPEIGAYWNTLGTASYRAGDWKGAVDALTKSMKLRKGGDGSDPFFLAMAYWHLGDKEQARTWYDKAVRWMEENKPQDAELRQFRAEAAELLGVKGAPMPKPVPPAPPEEHGAGVSLDLKNRTARIAGNELLVLAIDEQVEALKDNVADDGGTAFRLDDRGESAVPAHESNARNFGQPPLLAAVCRTDVHCLVQRQAQFLDHGLRQDQPHTSWIDDTGDLPPSHLFLGQQALASQRHVVSIDQLEFDTDPSHAVAADDPHHDAPPGADENSIAGL